VTLIHAISGLLTLALLGYLLYALVKPEKF
jgi:K+-transporting ATPase KdpF subunit